MTSKGLSLRDKKILDMAASGKTAEEIGAELGGMSPARVAQVVDDLTRSMDWLSTQQQFLMLQRRLWKLTADLEQAVERSGQDPDVSKIYLESIKTTLEQVEKAELRIRGDMETVQAAYARELMGIVEKSFYVTLDRLERRMPDIPRAELEAEFADALVWTAAEIDARERDVDE